MSLAICRHCGLGMTEKDSALGVCPGCGQSLKVEAGPPPVRAKQGPPPRTLPFGNSSAGGRSGWGKILIPLLLLVAALGYADYRKHTAVADQNDGPTTKSNKPSAPLDNNRPEPASDQLAPPDQTQNGGLKAVLPDEPTAASTLPEAADWDRVRQQAGLPDRQFARDQDFAERQQRMLERARLRRLRVLDEQAVGNDVPNLRGGERVMMFAGGSGRFAVMDAGRVRVLGQATQLNILGVNGQAEFDASNCLASEVVLGDVNGNCTVKVNSPNGLVTVANSVNGQADMTIMAPGGTVIFGKMFEEGLGTVNGNVKITILAKKVEFWGEISGQSQIDVTLTSGGRLKFVRLNGNAQIVYRKQAENDPAVTVDQGELKAQGKLREEKPR